jgi:hypothetical protein
VDPIDYKVRYLSRLLFDWTHSCSKPTPGSSSKSRHDIGPTHDVQPYQIKHSQSTSLGARFNSVFSTPNLQVETSKLQERKLRRSHSATSLGLPQPSPLSPLRLPSLDSNEDSGVPWSVALNESLRLSHFPFPPNPKQPRASLDVFAKSNEQSRLQVNLPGQAMRSTREIEIEPQTPSTVIQIRVQEPTSTTTPRPSTSVRGTVREHVPFAPKEVASEDTEALDESEARRSVHLYSMRISHHLRSGSLLSWDNVADAPDLPNPPRAFRDRSVSDLSRMSQEQKPLPRHERQTSSSGFASVRVPSKWGNVVSQEVREDKSSVYSSRPQSPPDSFGGSMINVSQVITDRAKNSSIDLPSPRPRRSNSYPTDNDETPRPAHRYGLTGLRDVTTYSAITGPSTEPSHIARNNSVASTKVSKFREEFSPSPPKKKLIPSSSIMKYLNPKRSSVRSHSEANIKPSTLGLAVDGLLEVPDPAGNRERRQSKSIVSMEAEQKALGHDKQSSPMWNRALKKYQDERATMFLPKNKELATQSSPIRERSGSISVPRPSVEEEAPPPPQKFGTAKRFSAPLLEPPSPGSLAPHETPSFFSRRTALVRSASEDVSPSQELQMSFHRQSDNAETVGAWGRYPSHSRAERTLSAGRMDLVDSRDFALEAAINFATGKNSNGDEDDIDPTQRPPTPPLLPGEKKRKKKVGHTRMAKSNSMTFGRNFFKNYAKIFRSQSIEFNRHGHGHRSSISTGGTLRHPELEMLPDVWRGSAIKEGSREHSNDDHEYQAVHEEVDGPSDRKGKGKLQEDTSTSTIRPLNITKHANASLPRLDGPADEKHSKDTARVWSAYYEQCLPSFPRASTEPDIGLEEFGKSTRCSFDSRGQSSHSHTLPGRLNIDSREASRVRRTSNASGRPATEGIIDRQSIVSVRRSTMDLVALYKEQEDTERERVLSLMRVESRRQQVGLAGL